MVVFQPWTVTPPHLGYVAIVTNLSSPSAPPDSTVFLGRSFPSFILPPPHHQTFVVVYLFLFVPTPHLLARRKSPPTWTFPTPATRQPWPLVSAPRTACLRLPTFPVTVRPPVYAPDLRLGPCQPLGGGAACHWPIPRIMEVILKIPILVTYPLNMNKGFSQNDQ